MTKRATGTREWAEATSNCLIGCNGPTGGGACRYCYAREIADRFGQCAWADWERPRLRNRDERTLPRSRSCFGSEELRPVIMFPSTHDICAGFEEACFAHLQRMLSRGNRIVLVTKGNAQAALLWPARLVDYRDRIKVRITITSDDDALSAWWEPGAPEFAERANQLTMWQMAGFRTSVSIEPCLDFAHLADLLDIGEFDEVETIWLGTMNQIARRVRGDDDETRRRVQAVREAQAPETLRATLQAQLNRVGSEVAGKVRLKDSLLKVLGLPARTAAEAW